MQKLSIRYQDHIYPDSDRELLFFYYKGLPATKGTASYQDSDSI